MKIPLVLAMKIWWVRHEYLVNFPWINSQDFYGFLVISGKNSRKITLLISAPKVFTHSWIFWSVNSRRQDVQGSSLSKRRFVLLSRCNRRAFCTGIHRYGLLKCHRGIFCECFTFSTRICGLFSGAEGLLLGATFYNRVR